jgi:2-methylcitrate dehydratase PrpD
VTTLSARLAEFVVRTRYEDLTPRAIRTAKLCLLDAIGVSLGASGLEPACRPFAELAEGDVPRCTLLGFGRKASAESAALVNGALAHALDYEDAHDGVLLHPNAPTVPAILAIAEAHGPVTGRDAITALVVGCEVAVRLARAVRVPISTYGWYPPPIFAAFGAAAAGAKLLALDEQKVLDAFSLSLCQATCSGEIIHSPQSLMRAVRDAFVARAAVTSVLLARGGITGFARPFEGSAGFFATYARNEYDPDAVTRQLGEKFEIEDISFKPWPSCRGTHGGIEAGLAFRSELGIEPGDIERIQVRGGILMRMLSEPHETKRRPLTAIGAKFSVPFTIATALTKGHVQLGDFTVEAIRDSRVTDLAAKVDVVSDPAGHPVTTFVAVQLKNGKTHERVVTFPLGAPENPISEEQLVDKFVACARRAAVPVDTTQARKFASNMLALEQTADVGALLPIIAPYSR